MSQHIAIVEDEALLAANYRDLFIRHGYSVAIYATADEASTGLHQHLPDLAILDIGLGDDPEAGFDLCRELRAMAPQLPIIFLTARDNEIDIVSGLRLGADDYLTKDISQIHLLARITALLRRTKAMRAPEQAEQALRQGPLEINIDRLSVKWSGKTVPLGYTELWMVHALAKHPGHIKNRQQLMDAADVVLDDSTITSHVKRIRQKFQSLDPTFDRIETAYGLGYRWRSES